LEELHQKKIDRLDELERKLMESEGRERVKDRVIEDM
jgi:hypothetical protein